VNLFLQFFLKISNLLLLLLLLCLHLIYFFKTDLNLFL
jgi:hypothetical protein